MSEVISNMSEKDKWKNEQLSKISKTSKMCNT